MIYARKTELQPVSAKGFTLIELLVVVAIIALLIAIGVTGGKAVMKSQDITKTKNTITLLTQAIPEFASERNGSLPSLSNIGLQADSALQDNATNFLKDLTLTEKGQQLLKTLEKAKAVVLDKDAAGNLTFVSGPVDAWGQRIFMSGDQRPISAAEPKGYPGTLRWFWSSGPNMLNDSPVSGATPPNYPGNPVLGDDIGGDNNTTHK